MLNLNEILSLATTEGQQEFLELIAEIRKQAGENWLSELKEDFPFFYRIADLVVNHDFDSAYAQISAEYPGAFVVKAKLQELHTNLKEQIERKRF